MAAEPGKPEEQPVDEEYVQQPTAAHVALSYVETQQLVPVFVQVEGHSWQLPHAGLPRTPGRLV